MLYIAGRGAYNDRGHDRWDGVVNMNGIMYAFTALLALSISIDSVTPHCSSLPGEIPIAAKLSRDHIFIAANLS